MQASVSCLALAVFLTFACDDKKTEDKPAASASASVAPIATPTPPPSPRPPIVSVEADPKTDGVINIQGERIEFSGDVKGKLTTSLTSNPIVFNSMIEVQAARNTTMPHLEIVIASLKAAKAKGATIKTAMRDLATLGQLEIVFDHATPAACSVVAMIGKDSSIMVWPFGGGTGQRFSHGMAGPDLTLGSEGMRKASAACESNIFFVSGGDAVKWGLVFDLAIAAKDGDAGTMRATQVMVLTAPPVGGRKVSE